MHGTIYDFRSSPLLDLTFPSLRRAPARPAARTYSPASRLKVGMITNPRSRRHLPGKASEHARVELCLRAPDTRADLRRTLFEFAADGIDLLVIDGGDGTVRDVLTCSEDAWGDTWPQVAVLPSGKTNALAADLGISVGWSLDDAIAAAERRQESLRAPIEIERLDAVGGAVRGFLFGAGAFVKGTEFAQRSHRWGIIDGVAVGLAVAWGVGGMMLGGASGWAEPSRMDLRYGRGSTGRGGPIPAEKGERMLMLATTLHTMPAGLRPFGPPRPGLKTFVADAPARRLAISLPAILSGKEKPVLAERGYHRVDTASVEVDLASPFILDGELFPAGAYVLRTGSPLRFVVP